jgi:hypothetical protein
VKRLLEEAENAELERKYAEAAQFKAYLDQKRRKRDANATHLQDDESEADDNNMDFDDEAQPWDGSHGDTHIDHEPVNPKPSALDQPPLLGKQVSNLHCITRFSLTSLAG